MSTQSTIPKSFLVAPRWPTLEVTGPDAASWLQGIVTCDVLGARPDRVMWGSLLSKQGKVDADLQIVGTSDALQVAISGGDAQHVLGTLDRYLVMEDAEVSLSEDRWVIAFGDHGHALALAEGLALARLPWLAQELSLGHAPAQQVDALEKSASDVFLSPEQWHAWLIEHGVPRYGVDYGPDDNLHAAALERTTVDWSKGCYLGQEVVCMQDMRGKVKRRLVSLRSEEGDVAEGAALTSGGQTVGRVTSAHGQRAIGAVEAPHFEPESALEADGARVIVGPLLGL